MSKNPSNTTQQEKLGSRVTDILRPLGIGKDEKFIYPEKVSIIHNSKVTEFNPFATPAGRYAINNEDFEEVEITDSQIITSEDGHAELTFIVKKLADGSNIVIKVGKEVPEYFFKAEDPPSGGKNKRKNRKSTKSKKSKKSKKSRKNRKKTIRRR
tara:strand:- start:227 stop:691 length:465 start_codon:yes stop_codon:yes gene_type:complete